MKKPFPLFWLWIACLIPTSSVRAQDAAQLLGRWRSVETSKGGIGAMYDFLANGIIQFSPGAIVPGAYRLEGARLTVNSGESVPYEVSFTGDDHLRLNANGQGEDYTRLGNRKTAQSVIAGEWTGTREMNGQKILTHWIFGNDASALFMIRFTTQTGTYTVQNGRLLATFDGRIGLDGTISLSDGVLSISRSGGRVTRLAHY